MPDGGLGGDDRARASNPRYPDLLPRNTYPASVGLVSSPAADDSLFPLVLYSLPERLDSEFVQRFTAKADAILARREPHVTLVDLRSLRAVPSALVRKELGAWSTAHESKIRRYSVASGVVTDSAVIRGASPRSSGLPRRPTRRRPSRTRTRRSPSSASITNRSAGPPRSSTSSRRCSKKDASRPRDSDPTGPASTPKSGPPTYGAAPESGRRCTPSSVHAASMSAEADQPSASRGATKRLPRAIRSAERPEVIE